MKLRQDQLAAFVQDTIIAVNTGAWNARENGGVRVEFGNPEKGEAKIDFQVELVLPSGGINGISRTATSSPSAAKVTTTQNSSSGETQVTSAGQKVTTEQTTATTATDTTSVPARTTTATEQTLSNSSSTPAGRTSTTTADPTVSTETTAYAGDRTITVAEGSDSSSETITPATSQQTQQQTSGQDVSVQEFNYSDYEV